jgi:hypothetical protein
MAEKRYRLKDESTGFHDPATGLKIVRGQEVKLGTKVGKLTMQAIQVGRLIEVSATPSPVLEAPRSRAHRKARQSGEESV